MSETERSVLRSSAAGALQPAVSRYWWGVSPNSRLNSRLKCQRGREPPARAPARRADRGSARRRDPWRAGGGGRRAACSWSRIDENVLAAFLVISGRGAGRSSSCAASTWARATAISTARAPRRARRSAGLTTSEPTSRAETRSCRAPQPLTASGGTVGKLIAEAFGLEIAVVVRTGAQLASVVRRNPLGDVATDRSATR